MKSAVQRGGVKEAGRQQALAREFCVFLVDLLFDLAEDPSVGISGKGRQMTGNSESAVGKPDPIVSSEPGDEAHGEGILRIGERT